MGTSLDSYAEHYHNLPICVMRFIVCISYNTSKTFSNFLGVD